MEDIMKIVKSFEVSGLLIEGFSEKIKNEAKEQKEGLLWDKLAASLLGSALTGTLVTRVSKGTIRAIQNF